MKSHKYMHDYERRLERYKQLLEENKSISDKNKGLITEFVRDCKLKESNEIPTLSNYYRILIDVASKYLKKDFTPDDKKLTEKDFKIMEEQILKKYPPETGTTYLKYNSIIRKFDRWIIYRDKIFDRSFKQYPERSGWIPTTTSKKNKKIIRASDILTLEEVEKIIDSAENPRDIALLSVMYETGARIGDLNIQIKDLKEDKHGYLIDLAKGKTGSRNVLIIFSAGKLAEWLSIHPRKYDKEAYIWCGLQDDKKNGKVRGEPIGYDGVRRIIHRAVEKAGIKKRVYPHLFRHSRVTHLLMDKQLNEQQAKVYFGWSPSSTMLSQYSHLTSRDVNKAMLRINGIEEEPEEIVNGKKVIRCPTCKKPNEEKVNFCGFCGRPINYKTLIKIEELKTKASDLTTGLLKSNMTMDDYFRKIIREELIRKK